jgi:hypothetical protein
MKDTGFTVPEAHLGRVATCYKTDFSTGEITVVEEAARCSTADAHGRAPSPRPAFS